MYRLVHNAYPAMEAKARHTIGRILDIPGFLVE